jgi:hypothetical protein
MGEQLQLLTAPVVPDLLSLARETVSRRRRDCIERYKPGIRLVDDPRDLYLRVYRGDTLLAQALRPVQDLTPPGLVDAVGWLHREARAWHTLTCFGERPTLAQLEEREAAGLGRKSRKRRQLQVLG